MFDISEKIVCVDDRASVHKNAPVHLKKGSIYVVRGMGCGNYSSIVHRPAQCIILVGLFSANHHILKEEIGFDPYRFRKLTEIQEENRAKRKALQPV